MLKITLSKSTISETPRNRATVHALGLRKTNRFVFQEDTPVIRGMIHHVKHLLTVEEVDGITKVRKRAGKKAAEAAPAAAPKAKAAKAAPSEAPKPKTTAKKATTKKEDS